jgi:hypothetical protein
VKHWRTPSGVHSKYRYCLRGSPETRISHELTRLLSGSVGRHSSEAPRGPPGKYPAAVPCLVNRTCTPFSAVPGPLLAGKIRQTGSCAGLETKRRTHPSSGGLHATADAAGMQTPGALKPGWRSTRRTPSNTLAPMGLFCAVRQHDRFAACVGSVKALGCQSNSMGSVYGFSHSHHFP